MDKKLRKTITITLIMIIVLCLAVTSAYFAVSVSNTNNEKINTTSSKLSIVYTDCASSKQSDCANMTKNLGLGEYFEKTFKVYNNGTMPVDYKIIFKQLTNTFQNNDLVYTDFFSKIYYVDNIKMLGRVIFTDYYFYFILAGFVLLIGMISAILLSKESNKTIRRYQLVYQQLSREVSNAVFLVH
mgnify:CR=1 FL=1